MPLDKREKKADYDLDYVIEEKDSRREASL